MKHFALHTAQAAQWHALVNQAEAAAQCELTEDTESYLVFMLMRFIGRPALGGQRFAIACLRGLLETGDSRRERIRALGDQCLLLAGLFPEHALRCAVPLSYFVQLGRAAYGELAGRAEEGVFGTLSMRFVDLMDVLQNMRELDEGQPCLDPLHAHEVWIETGSQHAFKLLRNTTKSLPARTTTRCLH